MRTLRALLFTTAMLISSSAFADPTAQQCIVANERSIQFRSEHKLRAARDDLLQCAAPSCPAEIRGECERRLATVTDEIPTVVLGAKDAKGGDLIDVRASIDGDLIAIKLDGTPLSLDPGEHVFRFEVPSQAPVEERVVIRAGEKYRAIRVTIGAPAPVIDTSRRNPTVRALGIAAAGVGLAGVIVGAVFGGLASGAWSRSRDECTSPTQCPNYQLAVADHGDAVTFATVSTIGFIAGGISLAAGAVLFFAAPVVRPGATTTVGYTLGAWF